MLRPGRSKVADVTAFDHQASGGGREELARVGGAQAAEQGAGTRDLVARVAHALDTPVLRGRRRVAGGAPSRPGPSAPSQAARAASCVRTRRGAGAHRRHEAPACPPPTQRPERRHLPPNLLVNCRPGAPRLHAHRRTRQEVRTYDGPSERGGEDRRKVGAMEEGERAAIREEVKQGRSCWLYGQADAVRKDADKS